MPITKTEITDLENKLVEAITNGDIDFLDQALHADLLFMVPNGTVITKEMDLASHKAREVIVEALVAKIEAISIIEETAVVSVVYDTKGTMLGNPIQGQFRYIRIWKQFSNGLKVIGGSCVQL